MYNNGMLEKILVPTNGSHPSDRALQYAVQLAQISKKSQIILLHVLGQWWLPMGFTGKMGFISPITGKKITAEKYTREVIQLLETKATESMKKQTHLYNKSDVVIKSIALIGNVSDKILEFAKKEKIDLIVIGATSRKGIIPRIGALGSVSRNVLESSTCPVVLVH